jgi:hypothetical protein
MKRFLRETDFDKRYKQIIDYSKYPDDSIWDDDGVDSERQEIGSEETSINGSKLPYTFANNKGISWTNGSHNLDIGGGKFDNGTEHLRKQYGVINLIFDPYNRNSDFNNETLNKVEEIGGADSVTVNSCLNVIKGRRFIESVIRQAAEALKPEGVAFFKIYTGNRSGVPTRTPKGYQQNKRGSKYVPLIKSYFKNVWIDNGNDMIVAKNPIINAEDKVSWYPDANGEPRFLNLRRESFDRLVKKIVNESVKKIVNNRKTI